jgi:hypothetical protein
MRNCLVFIVLGISLLLPGQALAGPSFTATASFYQGFDVATGELESDPSVLTLKFGDTGVDIVLQPEGEQVFEFSAAVDFHFEYPEAQDGTVILALQEGISVAIFEDTDFDLIQADMLGNVEFLPNLTHIAFDSTDTVVLLTADNTYIKLGNLMQQSDLNVSFTYERDLMAASAEAVPEPSTVLLMGLGLIGLFVRIRRK